MLSGINIREKYKIFSKPAAEVEHRTRHSTDHAELNVFETRKETYQFGLSFENPVIVSMIQGKKVMHLRDKEPFAFVAGQTIVMPPAELMSIDFPEATRNMPTQCMALEISSGFVQDTLQWLNEHYPKHDDQLWTWTKDNFLLLNNPQLTHHVNQLIQTLVNNDYGRQMRAANTMRELILQLLQTQARYLLLSHVNKWSTRNRLAHVIQYIRKNINRNIEISELLREACMSRAQFFRAFQRELGETPVQFINKEKIAMAKRKMFYEGASPTSACFDLGFSSLNYFSRLFKQIEGLSPSEWKSFSMAKVQSTLLTA